VLKNPSIVGSFIGKTNLIAEPTRSSGHLLYLFDRAQNVFPWAQQADREIMGHMISLPGFANLGLDSSVR